MYIQQTRTIDRQAECLCRVNNYSRFQLDATICRTLVMISYRTSWKDTASFIDHPSIHPQQFVCPLVLLDPVCVCVFTEIAFGKSTTVSYMMMFIKRICYFETLFATPWRILFDKRCRHVYACPTHVPVVDSQLMPSVRTSTDMHASQCCSSAAVDTRLFVRPIFVYGVLVNNIKAIDSERLHITAYIWTMAATPSTRSSVYIRVCTYTCVWSVRLALRMLAMQIIHSLCLYLERTTVTTTRT